MASEFGLSVLVGRSALGLADLQLEDKAGGYSVRDIDPGTQTIVNQIVSSPDVDGGVLVGSRRAVSTATLTVRVWGAPGEIIARTADLRKAVQQGTFTITLSAGTATYVWSCFAGQVSGAYQPEQWRAGFQDVQVTVQRQPL